MGRLVTEGEWNEAHFSLTPDGEHDLITCGVLSDFLSHHPWNRHLSLRFV